MHVLHAYATFTPSFKREATKILTADALIPAEPEPLNLVDPLTFEENDSNVVELNPTVAAPSASFAHLAPRSKQELLHEVEALWARINDPSDPVFNSINLSHRLRNAYLSVYYAHAPNIRTCRETFLHVYAKSDVEKSAHGLLDALYRCSHGKSLKSAKERPLALEWAMEIWTDFRQLEESGRLSARIVENGYKYMIRALTLYVDMFCYRQDYD